MRQRGPITHKPFFNSITSKAISFEDLRKLVRYAGKNPRRLARAVDRIVFSHEQLRNAVEACEKMAIAWGKFDWYFERTLKDMNALLEEKNRKISELERHLFALQMSRD